MKMLVLGLTGGIASGKSTVSRMFSSLGAPIIDADHLAREVVRPGTPGYKQVIMAFGPEVVGEGGELNRRHLAAIVFSDAAERRRLEEIIHPLVYQAMQDELAKLRAQGDPAPAVVLDVPLLFESPAGLSLVDKTVVVWVPPDIQLKRLMSRDKLDRDEAKRRIAAQLSLDEKRRRADYCIDNSLTTAHTFEQVQKIWVELLGGEAELLTKGRPAERIED